MARKKPIKALLFGVAAIAVVALSARFYVVANNAEKQAAFIQRQIADHFGIAISFLEPPQIHWLPHPRLRMPRSQGQLAGQEAPIFQAGELDLELPWSVLWSETLRIEAIKIAKLSLFEAGVKAWLQRERAAELGPPPPMRWPELAKSMQIDRLDWVKTDESASQSIALFLSAVQPGETAHLRISSADPATWSLRLSGVPENTVQGILLDRIEAEWAHAAQPSQALQWRGGEGAYTRVDDWAFSGTLQSTPMPSKSQEAGDGTLQLSFRAAQTAKEGLHLSAKGSIAQKPIDVSWRARALPDFGGSWLTGLAFLAEESDGAVRIPSFEAEGLEVHGISITGAPRQKSNVDEKKLRR